MTRRTYTMFALASAASIAALVPAAAAPRSITNTVQGRREAAVPWTGGTITVITKLNGTLRGTDAYGVPITLKATGNETATYILKGGKPVGGLFKATMTGSGTRTETWQGGQSGVCNPDWTNKWSYKGPAKVSMIYNTGRLYIYPMRVTGKKLHAESGCGTTGPTSQTAELPDFFGSTQFFKVSPRANVIAGKKTQPVGETLTNMKLSGNIGTITIRWTLYQPNKACVNPGGGKCP